MAGIFFAGAALTAFAFTASTAQARELNLKEAIELSLKNSPDLAKSESQKKEAAATFSRYRGGLFPELTLRAAADTDKASAAMRSSASTSDLNADKTYTAAVDVTQPLFTGGKLLGGLRYGRALQDSAEQNYYSTRQSIVRKVIEGFYNLAEAHDSLVAAQENQQILDAYSKITKRYEKIGRTREIDRIQSTVNVARSRIDIQDAEQKRNEADASLKKLLCIEQETGVKPKFSISVQPLAKISVNDALTTAEANNPALRAARLNVDKVKAENQIDSSVDMPSLELTGSAGYMSPDRDNIVDDRTDFYSVGLTLKVPFFSGLSSFARRREHKEKFFQAERDLQIKRKEIREQLDVKLNDAAKLYAQLIDVQDIVKQSRRALDLANSGYNRGIVSSVDIVQFQRNRYESERLFISTQYGYLRAVLEVRELLGTDLERVYAQ